MPEDTPTANRPRSPRVSETPAAPPLPVCPSPHPALEAELREAAAMFSALPPETRQSLALEARLALRYRDAEARPQSAEEVARVLGRPGCARSGALPMCAILLTNAIEAAWSREHDSVAFATFTRLEDTAR